ncbi:hypothetical protein [Flavobacterium sp. NRK1]|uniref:hypothetical protein n=1 Tax=Flavobacterium sp. NRK1 TaxID=2954929 RepID=UPI0020921477|nr:hypothetical protein [Flavobacterium sp. NRK1]MCO6147521.1 hypothetical protein [Flavobacterium sp. NRK1]
MAKKKITLAKLDIDTDKLIKAAKKSKEVIEELKEELINLQYAGQGASQQFQSNYEDLKELTKAFEEQIKTIKQQIEKNEDLADSQKTIKKELQNTIEANKNLANSYTSVATSSASALQELDNAAIDALHTIATLNSGLTENKNLMAQSGESTKTNAKTFDEYKTQVADSFNQINLFNGGIGGLISRAEEAGGAGPLLKTAFSGIAQGIGGMTKAAITFAANPMGLILTAISAALSGVISYFKDTQEGIDAVTAVTRPLQSVFSALMGVAQNVGKFLINAFSSPKKAMGDLYEFVKQNLINRFTAFGTILEGIMELDFKKISNGVLQAGTGVEDVIGKTQKAAQNTGAFFDEAIKRGQEIDKLQKELDKSQADYTKKMSELSTQLDAQKSIADDTNLSNAEREKAAIKALELAKEQNTLAIARMDTEIKIKKLKLEQNGLTDEENKEIAEMEAKRNEAYAANVTAEKGFQDKIDSIREDAHKKELARRQKLLDDALAKQKQMLDLYVSENNSKAKNLKEALDYENNVASQSLAIAKTQLEQKKINETEYKTISNNIEQTRLNNILQHNLEHGRAMINAEIAKSKSLFNTSEKLTQDIVDKQKQSLDKIHNMKLEQLAKEKGLQGEELNITAENLATATTQQLEYYTEKLKLDEEYGNQKKEVEDTFKNQEETEKQRIEQEKAEKAAEDLENNQTEYEKKVALEDERANAEKAKYDQWEKDGVITHAEAELRKQETDEESARIKRKLLLENAQTQLGTMQSVADALTQAFGQSKELAIAQATMNAGQAILSIWSGTITSNPLIDAALKAALTASTAVKTAKQIKEIKSAKKPKSPKFAQGGLMPVGGNRHSAGGTLFTGADGTQFEAEQGELIGVMNRNAARHFMAFNNAFPAGGASAPNYFAGGGIVSREIAPQSLNTDELAMKIANANRLIPAPVVAVQDIVTQGNSYVQVREAANF